MLFTPMSPCIIYSIEVENPPTLSLRYRWLLRSHAKPCYNRSFFRKHWKRLSCPLLLSFLPSFAFNLACLFIVLSVPLFPRFPSFVLRCWCAAMVCKAAVMGHAWDVTGRPFFLSLKGLVVVAHAGADMCIRGTHTAQLSVEKYVCGKRAAMYGNRCIMCVCVGGGGGLEKETQLSIFICFWECWMTIDFCGAKRSQHIY